MPYVNRRELATIIGASLVTVSAWVGEGMPHITRGRKGVPWEFDTSQCIAWIRERDVFMAIGNTESDTMAEAELRDVRARAALRELDLAERRASVVPVEDAGAVLTELASAVRSRFEGVAARLGARVVAESDALAIQVAIETEIDAGLHDLAKFEPTAVTVGEASIA